MNTNHQIFYSNANKMEEIENNSINLIITSPPYPVIPMWDFMFSNFNADIKKALEISDGDKAFELMHQELDRVWSEVFRVLKPGGIACINIGDAVRTFNNNFKLFSNHTRILKKFLQLGFNLIPSIIWRKPTNAPNKFMGSGMLPPVAYVTLEHEYILILRKGGIRTLKTPEKKAIRKKSAYFWEERNLWFSDIWVDLKGTEQKIQAKNNDLRERSAAFPLELASRLINMFSLQEDYILDPFLGTGTTMLSAMVWGRNSIGFEIETNFKEIINTKLDTAKELSKEQVNQRLKNHLEFVKKRSEEKRPPKYINVNYNFPVLTKQEINLHLPEVSSILKINDSNFMVEYLFS